MDSTTTTSIVQPLLEYQHKTHPKQKQKQKQKPLFTILITLSVLATVVAGASIAALLVHQSKSEFPILYAKLTDSIRSFCSLIPRTSLCIQSQSYEPDRELVCELSLRLVFAELVNLTSLPKELLRSIHNDSRTQSALWDCSTRFRSAASLLNESIAFMEVEPGVKKTLTSWTAREISEMIYTARYDQEACLSRLESSDPMVADEVWRKVQKSREYMSKSLAILHDVETILDKLGDEVHGNWLSENS